MITWLQNKLFGWAVTAGIIVALLTVIYGKGRADQKAARAKDRLKARENMDDIQNDIGAMPPSEVKKELGKWAR